MSNAIHRIKIETLRNALGETYELFQTGKTFESVISCDARTLKGGQRIEAYADTRKHRTLQTALNSKNRKTFRR